MSAEWTGAYGTQRRRNDLVEARNMYTQYELHGAVEVQTVSLTPQLSRSVRERVRPHLYHPYTELETFRLTNDEWDVAQKKRVNNAIRTMQRNGYVTLQDLYLAPVHDTWGQDIRNLRAEGIAFIDFTYRYAQVMTEVRRGSAK